MPRRTKMRMQRVRNLIVVSTLSAVLLSISTYAWFVGMRTVNVSSFDVEIATAEGLALSLDGVTWADTVTINESNYDVESYPNNTNSWGGVGLIPMSTVGAIDTSVSRLILFEKASLTATPGGYRLLASRVDNYTDLNKKAEGYVVFDLFIRNSSGTEYYSELDINNEEAIYLTVDSEVTVSESGVQNTGIENSVRVAFAQVGRVHGTTTDQAVITGITCQDDAENGVTGICRTAQIWEPNDTRHVENAIKWYNKSCKTRVAADLTQENSYSGDCNLITDGLAYPTYAIAQEITSADQVDIYDGEAYNNYTDSETNGYLQPFPYFTDTHKFMSGTSRPEFFTLAPNSITKVRVYVYLEGQDIDNYDFAQIGKRISVKFGFTKERFTANDIDYNGPDVNQGEGPNGADLTPPRVIFTNHPDGAPERIEINQGDTFDPSADMPTAIDSVDGNLEVTVHGTVNTDVPGTYYLIYKAVDSAGNEGVNVRTVVVKPTQQAE